jgi:hypothetical protein
MDKHPIEKEGELYHESNGQVTPKGRLSKP